MDERYSRGTDSYRPRNEPYDGYARGGEYREDDEYRGSSRDVRDRSFRDQTIRDGSDVGGSRSDRGRNGGGDRRREDRAREDPNSVPVNDRGGRPNGGSTSRPRNPAPQPTTVTASLITTNAHTGPTMQTGGPPPSQAESRRQSRSPSRQQGHTPQSPGDNPQPQRPPPPKLADPFQEADKACSRIKNDNTAFDNPEWTSQKTHNPTPLANAAKTYSKSVKQGRIQSNDVPSNFIRSMSDPELNTAIRNAGVHMAHLNARRYELDFADAKWCKDITEKLEVIEPGVVFQAPVVENLIDWSVEVDDRARGTHVNGSRIDKVRTLIAIQVVEKDVEVLETTGFGQTHAPHPLYRRDYVRLVHKDDLSNPAGAQGMPQIRYQGNNHLTKTTYFRKNRTCWMSLENLQVAREGQIVAADFDRMANLMGMPGNLSFRRFGGDLKEKERRAAQEVARLRRRDGFV